MAQTPNPQEQYLLDQVYSGKAANFSVDTVIDTQFLRSYILELSNYVLAGRQSRGCLRREIHHEVMKDRHDLSDGRRDGGGPLPALGFHHCTFHGGFCADELRILIDLLFERM